MRLAAAKLKASELLVTAAAATATAATATAATATAATATIATIGTAAAKQRQQQHGHHGKLHTVMAKAVDKEVEREESANRLHVWLEQYPLEYSAQNCVLVGEYWQIISSHGR
jgi:hypothetical protein